MKDRPEQYTGQQKKPYVKPEVKQVELKPEEAVLGNCKTTGISGPIQALCNTPTQCAILGS